MAIRNSVVTTSLYGKKIFLLGTSNLGPVNTPIKAISASHIRSVFGEEGTLLEAYRTIKESDFDCEVFMVKITGLHSELYLNINSPSGEIIKDGFYLKAKHANEIYDDIIVTVDSSSIYINYSTPALGEYVLEYKYQLEDDDGQLIYDDYGNPIYKTMYDLAEEINEDARNLVGQVYCYANCDTNILCNSALQGVNPRDSTFKGGNTGLYYNKNMLYNCLSDTYAILEGHDIDLILPLECYFDDTFTSEEKSLDEFYNPNKEYLTLKNDGIYTSYYKQLLEFCKKQMRFGMITHGIMGMNKLSSPFINQEDYYNYLKHFKTINENIASMNKYRQLVSVCVGDLYTTYGTRISNTYIAYAALVANISIIENTTNKPLPVSFTSYVDFDTRMLNKIKDLGFTTFRYSILKKTVVVANGVTTSDDKNFKYLCNIRMCQLTMKMVREVLNTFVGESINELIKTKEIEQSVIKLLNELMAQKIVSGFGINSITNPNTGHILLDLSFRTAYMLENIRAYSGLTAVRYGELYE